MALEAIPRLNLTEWTTRQQGNDEKQPFHIPGYTGHIHGQQNFFSETYGLMTTRALTPREKGIPPFQAFGLRKSKMPTTSYRDDFRPFRRILVQPPVLPSKQNFIWKTTPKRIGAVQPDTPLVEYISMKPDTGDSTRFSLSDQRRIPGFDINAPFWVPQTEKDRKAKAAMFLKRDSGLGKAGPRTDKAAQHSYLWREEQDKGADPTQTTAQRRLGRRPSLLKPQDLAAAQAAVAAPLPPMERKPTPPSATPSGSQTARGRPVPRLRSTPSNQGSRQPTPPDGSITARF